MVGPFLAAILFEPFENRTILSGSQKVTISLVGQFILSGIQMASYQMSGSKTKWTI
jgi:hypothetical protein